MLRLAAAMTVVFMALIAASVGAILFLAAGLGAVEAVVVALALFTVFAVYQAASGRLHDRADVSGQVADLSRGIADLARQLAEFGRRLAAVEGAVTAARDKAGAATDSLAIEIEELGGLVKRLAESVAAHDKALAAPRTPAAVPVPPPAAEIETGPAEPSAGTAERAARGPFKDMEHNDILAVIRGAVEAGRIDLYLQPIVSLPQRKVRYYEALSRLRTDGGVVVLPADFIGLAEAGGLMPRIDNMILFRCVQVARRLAAKNRDVGLFANVSASTLIDAEFFPQLAEFLEANRAIASSLMLEFSQATVRGMGPIEQEGLTTLAELGYRFSLDGLTDLRLEPRQLADRGFRFVKVPANLLLNRTVAAGTDIHPADLSDLLGRFGIDLIAEKIESEGVVVDLLDYDVRFGQGLLFAPPRPVRLDALQAGASARNAAAQPAAGAEPKRPADAASATPAGPVPAPSPAAAERPTPRLAELVRGNGRSG